MQRPPGERDPSPGTGRDVPAIDMEPKLSVQDVERLVLPVVEVRRRAVPGGTSASMSAYAPPVSSPAALTV